MEEKRLDFNAPLLSVRRFTAPVPRAPIKKSSLPLYNSESKSSSVGNPGVIPFLWEQTPGHPKGTALDLPPGRIFNQIDPRLVMEEEEEESIYDDAFSDALRDCSVSGHSGTSSPDAMDPSGTFSKDPHVRDFMMDRFLPAAQAMATGSLNSAFRKPPAPAVQPPQESSGDGHYRRPLPLPFQHLPKVFSRYDDEEEEEEDDYGGTNHLSSKGCGLIPRFCFKSNFFLLNPVPGMKLRTQLPPRPGRNVDSRKIEDEVN